MDLTSIGSKRVFRISQPLGRGSHGCRLHPGALAECSAFLGSELDAGADLLILNHYGGDMVNSLTQAVQFGLKDKQVNGNDFKIIVPLYSELMAAGAGSNIEGVFGSMNWNWQLQDAGTAAFVKSFGEKYGFPPSGSAHTCYVQTLLYADAVTRAGTFNPCGVAEALEDFDFVFGVKVGGLVALLEATASDPLQTLVAFSSVAGRWTRLNRIVPTPR